MVDLANEFDTPTNIMDFDQATTASESNGTDDIESTARVILKYCSYHFNPHVLIKVKFNIDFFLF